MENPNEYDDDAYLEAANELDEVIGKLWAAGASKDDIKDTFENALRNAEAS